MRHYTPVNEIYVTAQFSASFGWWNEQLMSDVAFINNIKHCVKASILSMRAVLDLRRTPSSSSAKAPNTSTPAAPISSSKPTS